MSEVNYRTAIQQIREKYPSVESLTVNEVAAYLNCDVRKVRRLIKTNKLYAVDTGVGVYHIYRIPINALAKMMSRTQK